MATYFGSLTKIYWNDGSLNWPRTRLFQFAARKTKDSKSPEPNLDRWYHMYFRVAKSKTPSRTKPFKLEYSKISLFGKFNDKLEFSLSKANARNKRLKRRIDIVFKALSKRAPNGEHRKIIAIMSCHDKRAYCVADEPTESDKTPSSLDLFRNSEPRGWLYVFHTYWLGNFVKIEDWDRLNDIIKFYAQTEFAPNDFGLINVSSLEGIYQTDGDDFSIFKKRLHKDGDVTTSANGANSESDEVDWLVRNTYMKPYGGEDYDSHTEYYVRISKTGVIEVREESRFREKKLSKFLDDLLRFRPPVGGPGYSSTDIDKPKSNDSKSSAIEVARQFMKIVLEKFNSTFGEAPLATDPESVLDEKKARIFRERQRYTVIMLSRLKCTDQGHQNGGHSGNDVFVISPAKLMNYSPIIRNLLEGTMVFERDKKELKSPLISKRFNINRRNNSTWKDELCIFGSERCLIYFEPLTVLESDGRIINYEDYWKCIVRGIEHTISVRTALHIMETSAKKAMNKIPDLVKAFNYFEENPGGGMPSNLKNKLEELTTNIARILRFLPAIREVSVASSAFRASHAVDKFKYLNEECFRFPDILKHIQQSIDELTDFLQFFKQQQLTIIETVRVKRENRMATSLALMGLMLAVLAAFYTSPIFFDAFLSHDVCNGVHDPQSLFKCFGSLEVNFFGKLFLGAFFLVHTSGLCLYIYSTQQRRAWVTSLVILSWILLVLFMGWWFTLDTEGYSHLREWIYSQMP
jgi:hypothetical protein